MTVQKSNISNFNEKPKIFDTNIFLLGIDLTIIKGKIFTIPGVIEEIEVNRYLNKNRNILTKIQIAVDSNKLIIKNPKQVYKKRVKEKAKETGDYIVLSEIDIDLIALALNVKESLSEDAILFTNDYSMENLASELNLSFISLGKEGIKKKRSYEIYCPFCDQIKNSNQQICDTCGMKLKRRVKRHQQRK